MRKAELVPLLQNSPPPGQSHASTSPPPPPTQTWELIDDRRLRKPSPQEMDIFEQQEMSKVDHKSRPNLINGIRTVHPQFQHPRSMIFLACQQSERA